MSYFSPTYIELLQNYGSVHHFNLPKPCATFFGRVAELKTLLHHYNDTSTRIIIVSGLAGQGKTAVVRQFINQILDTSPDNEFTPLITFFRESQFRHLTDGINKCAKHFELTAPTLHSLLSSIKEKIFRDVPNVKWVIVIDNLDVNRNGSIFPEILDLVDSNIILIVTTRGMDLPLKSGVKLVKLMEMRDSEAGQLLKHLSGQEGVQLCQTRHPLTIVKMANFIKNQESDNNDNLQEQLTNLQHGILQHLLDSEVDAILKNFKTPAKLVISTLILIYCLGEVHLEFLHELVSIYEKHSIFGKLVGKLVSRIDLKSTLVVVTQLEKYSLINFNGAIISSNPLLSQVLGENFYPSKRNHIFAVLFKNIDLDHVVGSDLKYVFKIWEKGSQNDNIVLNHASFAIFLRDRLVLEGWDRDVINFSVSTRKLFAQVFRHDGGYTIEMGRYIR